MKIFFVYSGLPYSLQLMDLASNPELLPPGAQIVTEEEANKVSRIVQRAAAGQLFGHAAPVPPLTFSQLRVINVARCNAAFFPITAKDGPWWGNAMAGECGEACNIVKKIDRDGINAELLQALGYELADVVTYADLLAARYDINLGQVVAQKFNIVSARRGCAITLPVEK